MKKIKFLLLILIIISSCQVHKKGDNKDPNIILVFVDDLGYGDVSCYNEQSKIITQNIDMLASEGIKFTDAHASSSQCSPTRYGLLTGRYSWRTRLQTGVLPHFDEPLIDLNRLTLAKLLKDRGYNTACIGKWHLGMGWQVKEGDTLRPRSWDYKQNLIIDYSKPLTISPNDYGFDYYFGINASNNMLPYCLIENHKVVNIPKEPKFPVYDTETGVGLVSDDYDSQKLESILFDKAMKWLNQRISENSHQPFFLYFPMSSIHRPCLPDNPFINTSKAGLKGDKVKEVDFITGQILDWLKENKLEENTLFIFTSDNGGRPGDPIGAVQKLANNDYGQKYHPRELQSLDSLLMTEKFYEKPKGSEGYHIYEHYSSGPFKGYKFDVYEGGHRVPFIVKWPARFAGGENRNQLVSTLDIMATVAEILDVQLDENTAEDSHSFLPEIEGRINENPRTNLVHKGWPKNTQALRKDNWKLIPYKNGGGLYKFPEVEAEGQLYNLEKDPGEKNNLYNDYPEKVEELKTELNAIMAGNEYN